MPILELAEFFIVDGYDSSSYNNAPDVPQGIYDGIELSAFPVGSLTKVDPVGVLPQSFQGKVLKTYFNDYYNGVWILPSIIDFGEVPAFETNSFTIWNSFLTPVTLQTVTSVNDENITLSGITANTTFQPLETKQASLSTDENGPPTIAATYSLGFDFGTVFRVNAIGTRSGLWPVEVNWDNPYSISYEYRTDIFVSREGKQQRRALRNKPRKTIAYRGCLTAEEMRNLNGLLALRQTRTFVAPEITRYEYVSQQEASGSTGLTLENIPAWLITGEQYLIRGNGNQEVRTLTNISTNRVEFSGVSGQEWPVGTQVLPLLRVRLNTSIRAQRVTNGVSLVNVNLEVDPGSEPFPESFSDLPQFEGREVLSYRPNWVSGIDVTYQYDRNEVDYGHGVASYFTPIDFGNRLHRLNYTGLNYQRMQDLKSFFQRQKGQQREFWLPSWEDDFDVVQDIAAGANSIRVRGTDIQSYFDMDKVHQCGYIETRAGDSFYLRVLDMFTVQDALGTDTVIRFDNVIGPEIPVSQIHTAGWLFLCRNATDRLTSQWLTNEVGTCNFSIRTLENLGA